MLVKIMLLFLAAIALLAMFGKYRHLLTGRRKPPLARIKTCPSCGRLAKVSERCSCGAA